MDLAYTVSGFGVGFLVGLTGVGGGSLMTPLLVFLFGFKPSVAVGTDLLFAAITKTGGVFVHHGKHGSVDWKIVGLLALGSLPFSVVTLFVLKYLASIGKETTGTITFSLGIALLLTACSILIRSLLMRKAAKLGQIDDEHSNEANAARFQRFHSSVTILTGIGDAVIGGCWRIGYGCLVVSLSKNDHAKNCRHRFGSRHTADRCGWDRSPQSGKRRFGIAG
jgi:uncharacterized membrane protein YfcA